MKKQAGLWIDHRKAVIVLITDEAEEIRKIESGVEKHVRFMGGDGSEDGSLENVRDRQFKNHLNNYYDQIIALLRDVEIVQIFGPGEAKGELVKRFDHEGLKVHILEPETVDKMTDRQIAAKVRECFSITYSR
jgi:hypothetical protein